MYYIGKNSYSNQYIGQVTTSQIDLAGGQLNDSFIKVAESRCNDVRNAGGTFTLVSPKNYKENDRGERTNQAVTVEYLSCLPLYHELRYSLIECETSWKRIFQFGGCRAALAAGTHHNILPEQPATHWSRRFNLSSKPPCHGASASLGKYCVSGSCIIAYK